MATLRKACHNCTSSKRKCTVQVPQCARCVQRGLQCVYDLEPLNAAAGQHNTGPELSYESSHEPSSGYCVMKALEPRALNTPGVCRPQRAVIAEMVRMGFQSVQGLLKERKPAIFIHPGFNLRGYHNHCASLGGTQSAGVNHPGLKHLLQLQIALVPIQEALTALQALIIHLALSLFGQDQTERANAETHLNLLSEWTEMLLDTARRRLSLMVSPWQTWLFGESVRRTIFMSHALAVSHFSFKQRYCSNCLFFESLPFDGRVGLWMAESPQAWIAVAQVKLGEDVGEQLMSFHEFAHSLDGTAPELGGDAFLTMLAMGHNGRKMTRTSGN